MAGLARNGVSGYVKRRKRRLQLFFSDVTRYFLHRIRYKNPSPSRKELWINVSDIRTAIDDNVLSKTNTYKKINRTVNRIIAGDFWLHEKPIDTNKHSSFVMYFNGRGGWESTPMFQGYQQILQKGKTVRGCHNLQDLVALYENEYCSLYCQLKTEGIKSSLGKPDISPLWVYINKDGHFVYTADGNHRLNMAKVLGIKKIPVLVRARHLEWQLIREEYYYLGKDSFQKKYPALAEHPDLV